MLKKEKKNAASKIEQLTFKHTLDLTLIVYKVQSMQRGTNVRI